MQVHILTDGEHKSLTLFTEGKVYVASTESHKNFAEIQEKALAQDPSVVDLFDLSKPIARKFERLSERVTVNNGRVYFDGDEVHGAISGHIVRFLDEGVEDWVPLVRFLENVQANPNDHSRTQLYEWLDRREFTITHDGLIVGYKGVRKNDDGTYVSITAGPAIVDGVEVNGNVPNEVGSVIEMSRSMVNHDPSVGCSTGLHVGDWDYAKDFAQGAVLEVHVNPRDVGSVPTDCNFAKVRCCRYTVVDIVDTPHESAVTWGRDYVAPDLEDEDEDYDLKACATGTCDCDCDEDDPSDDAPESDSASWWRRWKQAGY